MLVKEFVRDLRILNVLHKTGFYHVNYITSSCFYIIINYNINNWIRLKKTSSMDKETNETVKQEMMNMKHEPFHFGQRVDI